MDEVAIADLIKTAWDKFLEENILVAGKVTGGTGIGGKASVVFELGKLEEIASEIKAVASRYGQELDIRYENTLAENLELRKQLNELEAKYSGESPLEWRNKRYEELLKKFGELEASRKRTETECNNSLAIQKEATRVQIEAASVQLRATDNAARQEAVKLSEVEKKYEAEIHMRQTAEEELSRVEAALNKKIRSLEEELAGPSTQNAEPEESNLSPEEKRLTILVKELEEKVKGLETSRDEKKRLEIEAEEMCAKNSSWQKFLNIAKDDHNAACVKVNTHKEQLSQEKAKLDFERRKREGSVTSIDSSTTADSRTTVETVSTAATDPMICSVCRKRSVDSSAAANGG
jgi:chromosome segregation ATPase